MRTDGASKLFYNKNRLPFIFFKFKGLVEELQKRDYFIYLACIQYLFHEARLQHITQKKHLRFVYFLLLCRCRPKNFRRNIRYSSSNFVMCCQCQILSLNSINFKHLIFFNVFNCVFKYFAINFNNSSNVINT